MTDAEQWALCLRRAEDFVKSRRDEAGGVEAGASYVYLAVMVVTAAVSAYGQYQSGKQQQLISDYNAHQQDLNAQMGLMQMQAESETKKRAAEAQFALRQQEANARFNNATSIENSAESQSANARETARRRTEEYGRFVSTQRANIAANGIVEASGTPLDILAETQGKIQLEREDALYADNLNRQTLFREASMERLGGKLALAGATLDRNSSLAGAGLTAAAGQAKYRSDMRASELTRLTGDAALYGAKWQATGTLLSGISSAAGTYASKN